MYTARIFRLYFQTFIPYTSHLKLFCGDVALNLINDFHSVNEKIYCITFRIPVF